MYYRAAGVHEQSKRRLICCTPAQLYTTRMIDVFHSHDYLNGRT